MTKIWIRMSGGYEPEPVAAYTSYLRGRIDGVREIKEQWDKYYKKNPPKHVYYVHEYPSRRERPETWKEFRNRCAPVWMVEVEFYD